MVTLHFQHYESVCLTQHWDHGAAHNRAGYAFSSNTKIKKAVIKSGYIFSNQGDLTANPIFLIFFFWLWFLYCQNHTRRLREYKDWKQPLPDMSLYITPSQTSVFKPDVVDSLYFPAVTDPLQLKNCSLLFGQTKVIKHKGGNKVVTTIL